MKDKEEIKALLKEILEEAKLDLNMEGDNLSVSLKIDDEIILSSNPKKAFSVAKIKDKWYLILDNMEKEPYNYH